MHAEPAVQRELLRLAELDSDIARVTHLAKSLPQHQAIASLMEQRRELADALTAATTNADDLDVAARRAESDLVPVRARLERDRQRLDDGSVTDAKAVQGLVDEIEHLTGRIATLEDEQLEAMSRAEEAAVHRDQLAQQKEAVEQQLRDEVTARDEAVAGLKAEAVGVAQSRKELAAKLQGPLLDLYEKVRATSGSGAGALTGGRCGGCQLQLNVSDLNDIQRAPANAVLRCPECDRILVRTKEQ